MPIILNNDSVAVLDVNGNATTATKPMQTFSPKFFNSKLTGKGGSSKGLLTEKICHRREHAFWKSVYTEQDHI